MGNDDARDLIPRIGINYEWQVEVAQEVERIKQVLAIGSISIVVIVVVVMIVIITIIIIIIIIIITTTITIIIITTTTAA